jgi:regulator of RNase E activity RraA
MAIERPAPLGEMAADGYAPIDEGLKAKLLSVGVPSLSAVMFKRGLAARFFAGLSPLNPSASKFCGAAFTVRAIPVREDLRAAIAAFEIPSRNRRAFDAAPAGAVVVCSTGDKPHIGLIGDIMSTSMMTRGVAAILLDAGVADAHFISTMAFPVVCTGSAPVSSFAEIMVVDHDTPIGVRGVAVFPGDIIVGDQNGAVCIPRHLGEAIAEAAIQTEALEEFILERIRAGAPIDGTYPPNSAVMADYAAWKAARSTRGA